jgi:RHH-type rel operon transcriptional repressor/antitoxin RelB
VLALRLPKQVEDRLENLAARTGQTKSACARQAIRRFLDGKEDYLLAVARLKNDRPRISLDEVERRLGLGD